MTAAAAVAALACLLVVCGLTGRAAMVLAGTRELHGLELPLGLSVTLAIASLGVRLPGHGTTAAAMIAAVTLAAAWLARKDLTAPDLGALLAAGIVLVGTVIPFAAQGRFGILGVSMLDDIGFHYAFADSLRLGFDLPVAGEVNSYPIAPQALGGAIVSLLHSDDPAVFTALMMTTAIGTAVVAATALRGAPVVLRGLGAAAAGFGFLPAAYYGQSGFKETLVALLVLTIAVGIDRLIETGAWRPGTVTLLALPAGGALATYGAPAGAWLVGTAGLWLGATAILSRWRPSGDELRRLVGLGVWVVPVIVLMVLPQIDRLVTFDAVQNVNMGQDPKTFMGNMVGFIPLREALGVWPGGDFRLPPTELSTSLVDALAVVIALALVAGIVQDVRRRRLGLASGLVAALVVYLATRRSQGPYVTAKTMVILAPLAATLLLRWLFGVRVRSLRVAAWAGGVAAAALMLWSSSLSLRTVPVGSLYQALDLRRFQPAIKDRDVLFVGFDNYIAWELMGARVGMLSPNTVQPAFPVVLRPDKPVTRNTPIDGDSVTPDTLRRADLVITSGAGYASRLAGRWTPVRSTALYTLWRRTGPVDDKRLLEEGVGPGSTLTCRGGAPVIGSAARALVIPEPVTGPGEGWRTAAGAPVPGAGGFTGVGVGGMIQQTITLAPGDWNLSLQYTGGRAVRVTAPGLNRVLPSNLLNSGGMWPVGTMRASSAPTTVTVTVGKNGTLGRATGDSVGAIAATRPGGDRTVPAGLACGSYIDGYLTP